MSAEAAVVLPRQAVNAKLVALIAAAAIFLGVFLSGFVIDEPAPYELYMAPLMAVWALFGLRISRAIAPLIVMLVFFNIGGMIAMTQMANLMQTPLYLAVSLFLALTAIFYAAILEARSDFYRLIVIAWTASAVVTATFGICGYFNAFPGAEIFTRYGRAMGFFQDPNVFGPFLVLPGIYLFYRILTGKPSTVFLFTIPLLVIALGILLSFSRGAWGLFVCTCILLTAALFLQSRSGRFRLRVIVMSVVVVTIVALAVLAILQIPGVSEFFLSRAHLEQSYDTARLGRFARYGLGLDLALQHPLGIGPLVFGQIYGEDTHDIWLKALLDYSWLGFLSWLALTIWTIVAGFPLLLRNRPWQPYVLCAYVVFIGHILLGTVIDIDHWRHLYLLIGMIWGGIALEKRHQRSPAAPHLSAAGQAFRRPG
ncbi:MAG: hypothetical protein EPN45_05965 [Rhizobiaceae bacterium]|nr:MAG: hypothetical protein EPN45_05965 [Rhizobiaceae bacterium]